MILEYYRDADYLWRWRAKSRNGRIVADGAEGYATQRNVERAMHQMVKLFRGPIRFVDDKNLEFWHKGASPCE